MAELAPSAAATAELLARDALAALHATRRRLSDPVAATAGPAWQAIERTADHLAFLAADPACPWRLEKTLLDWRDRLGSYCLTARAFAEADLAPSLIDQLVRRGLDEAIDEAAARLGALSPARDERVATAR